MLVLVVTNDLGSGLLYFGIFLAMLYIATARFAYVLVGLGLFAVGGWAAYHEIGHVRERVTVWLQPWTDHKVFCPQTGGLAFRQDCAGYQLVKSLYSIANGGFGGTGLGKGTFTDADGHQLIPYVNTDFIYSALAQELGLIGVSALLLVFMLFVARGMKIALQVDDGFSKLLAVRARVRLRAADVHHRRRRPARDPAHRNHASVRLIRWLVDRRELRDARRPAPRLPPRQLPTSLIA